MFCDETHTSSNYLLNRIYTERMILLKDLKFQLDTDEKSNFVELLK